MTPKDESVEDTWPVLRLFEPPTVSGPPPLADQSAASVLSPHLLDAVLRCAPEGIAVLESQRDGPPRVIYVNEGFCRMTRLTREEAVEQGPRLLGSDAADRALLEALEQPQWRTGFAGEATARRRDGSVFVVDLTVVALAGGLGGARHWVAYLRDISERKARMVALEHQTLHDLLTSLPNRDLLKQRLSQALTGRAQGASVGLLIFDINAFREVNDSLGPSIGDEVLRQVASRVRPVLHPRDTLARLGGDRFAALLPHIMDMKDAVKAAQGVFTAFAAPFAIRGQTLEVGVSVGVAVSPAHATDPDGMLRSAEIAMNAAKQSHAGFLAYSPDQETPSVGSLTMRVDLREAIAQDQLVLHFQPELHLRTGRITWVECLVRWQHPERGLLPPDQFISLADRSALIKPLTEWVLDRALSTCRTWHDAGVSINVAVNLPTQSLLEPFLPQRLFGTLHRWGLAPSVLKLEITESGIMADPPYVLAILHMLRSMGVRLSLDDFGTGFSSLSHMRDLPVDEIKIDKSFIMGMGQNDSDAAIVRSVISLAHSLGHEVVAEGVADEATLKTLTDLGCDHVQGFHLSPPVTSSELLRWLAASPWIGNEHTAREP